MIRAILYDLDGLLIDSEPLHMRCWQEVLAGVGIDLSEADYVEHWIRAGRGLEEFCRLRRLTHDPAGLRSRKLQVFTAALAAELRPMRGAAECLARFRGTHRAALVTAGYPDFVRPAVAAVGFAGFFETIITRGDVSRAKPAPDAYVLAAERLGLEPASCVCLDDAEKGIRAAHAAGMKSVAVPTPHTADNDFSLATAVVSSLDQVTPEFLAGLESASESGVAVPTAGAPPPVRRL